MFRRFMRSKNAEITLTHFKIIIIIIIIIIMKAKIIVTLYIKNVTGALYTKV